MVTAENHREQVTTVHNILSVIYECQKCSDNIEEIQMNQKKLNSLNHEVSLLQTDIEDLEIITEQMHRNHSITQDETQSSNPQEHTKEEQESLAKKNKQSEIESQTDIPDYAATPIQNTVQLPAAEDEQWKNVTIRKKN